MSASIRLRSRIGSWGGSLALRIPRAAVEGMSLRSGDDVELVVEGDSLVMRLDRPRYTLEQLVAEAEGLKAPDSLDDRPAGDEAL